LDGTCGGELKPMMTVSPEKTRKGLSQILYLIIAASVLMMIAMIITFTATDTIFDVHGEVTVKAECPDNTTVIGKAYPNELDDNTTIYKAYLVEKDLSFDRVTAGEECQKVIIREE
jgi:cell division protein FtsL